jgi:predicted dehydrogenase
MIVPKARVGWPWIQGPSDKLNIACVGVGGQADWDMEQLQSENFVALCDVDLERAAKNFARYPNVPKYRDYREMLAKEKDKIDAVLVAIPDHMHAPVSMMAIKLGKHVYCEKPLTRTVFEARSLAKASREAKVDSDGQSRHGLRGNRLINEWIWDGAIRGADGSGLVWTGPRTKLRSLCGGLKVLIGPQTHRQFRRLWNGTSGWVLHLIGRTTWPMSPCLARLVGLWIGRTGRYGNSQHCPDLFRLEARCSDDRACLFHDCL